jgi:uncharacterized protein YnzC (UPF0291/DUF896 family)
MPFLRGGESIRVSQNYLADIKEQFKDNSDHFGMMDEILDTLTNEQSEDLESGSDRNDYPF